MDYLKKRWAEPSTRYGLGVIATYLACLLFPEQRDMIMHAAGALGLGAAVTPDKPQ